MIMNGSGVPPWLVWALLSAAFAAMTAILAKLGVQGVDSDIATFVRTIVIVVVLGTLLALTGKLRALEAPQLIGEHRLEVAAELVDSRTQLLGVE